VKASIGVLAYNETASLSDFLPNLYELCQRNFGEDFEILVVDDCSTDGTPEFISRMTSAMPRIRTVRHEKNLGYAAASRTALEQGLGEYLFVIDGDGQHAPEQIVDLAVALDGGADIALPIRTKRAEPLQRRIASWILTTQCRFILGFPKKDINGGIKAVRRDVVESVGIKYEVNLVNPEIWTRARNAELRVAFVEVEQLPRLDGTRSRVIRKPVPLLLDVTRYVWQLGKSVNRSRSAVLVETDT
jgi:glycosyltransferase involved in cell wall biosynthesis